jgi:hypothetical protein
MKKSFVLVVSGILAVLANTAQAAPLANAKILNLGGTVTIHQGKDVASAKALKVGDIIVQGDVITTCSQSTAKIAFSNGSIIDLDPNSQLELQIVRQEAYKGQKVYQQLEREPSQSITLLNMNYGSLFGHVKKLTDRSKFNVKTPLGVTIIKGTRFRVSFLFDPVSSNFRFLSNNIDGIVEVITTADAKNIDYGMQNNAEVRLATESYSGAVKIPIPPAHVIAVTLPGSDPMTEEIVDFEKNLPPDMNKDMVTTPPAPPRPPTLTDPDDSEIPSGATG